MSAVSAERAKAGDLDTPNTESRWSTALHDRVVPSLAVIVAGFGLALGCLSLSFNNLEAYPVPVLALVCLTSLLLVHHSHRVTGSWGRGLVALAVFALATAFLLQALPEYLYGFQINGVIHRSLISAVLLLAASLPLSCSALYYLCGATPTAKDVSRYPLLILPVFVAVAAYGLLLSSLVTVGAPHLDWNVIATPYQNQIQPQVVYSGSTVTYGTTMVAQAGMRNHILGTLELIGLTALISLPVGVGTGVFLSEYSAEWLSRLVAFVITALRSISVFILGLTAFSLVAYSRGTLLSDIFGGYYYDLMGNKQPANGSFLTAALLLSMLVIPMIARATEVGCRSLPVRLREASVALGASKQYGLRRIVLPWALPNILTALLLGCAEAAGSAAVLMWMARTGEYGTGPLGEVTSLAYLIFDSQYGLPQLTDLMRSYQFAVAIVLLVIITALTIPALVLKRRFSQRYRGA